MVSTEFDPQTGHGMIVLKPNSSATWRFNMMVVASLGIIMFIISMYFFLQGLWLILPFSGIELMFLVWGLYYCLKRSICTEVIIFDKDTVTIERGHHRAENKWEYNRAWSKIFVKPPEYRGHLKRIFIRSYGEELELGAFLNRDDRELFIKSLKHMVYA